MDKVILICVRGASIINASFALTRSLMERGHKVFYLTIGAHHKEYLEMQGFQVLNFDYDPIAPGAGDKSRLNRLGKFREGIRKGMLDLEQIYQKIEKYLEQVKVDVVLLDSNRPDYSIPFLNKKIPVINLSCTLSSLDPHDGPPVFSGLFPATGPGLLPSLRSKIAWARIFASQRSRETLRRIILRIGFGTQKFMTVHARIRKLGKKMKRTEYGRRLVAPEILLGSAYLDFPELNNRNTRRYAGVCVDTTRKRSDFDFDCLDKDKKLIYCAMGTCSKAYRHARNLYRCLFAVMDQLPDCQLILQSEGVGDLSTYGRIPENVRVFKTVPQLELLRIARLFINHGGHGSIREGALYGTPMIVFPGWHDQPGNAARVVYHGLGQRGSMKTITPSSLLAMIRDIINNAQIYHSIEQIQRKLLNKSEICSATLFIEEYTGSA